MVSGSLWLALALAAPVATQPVTVEIVAVGHAETPADRFEISALITAGADTDAAAAALLARRKQEVLDKVAAVGGRGEARDGNEFELFATDPAAAMSLRGGQGGDDKVEGKVQVSAIVTIATSTRSAITQAKAAITGMQGVKNTGTPLSSLSDPISARRTAKADALTKARTEADVYATRLGLGTATLIAISEKSDFAAMFQASNGKVPAFAMFQKSTSDTVITEVTMTVTYRIDPNR
jgi:uncharacterized protein YggE